MFKGKSKGVAYIELAFIAPIFVLSVILAHNALDIYIKKYRLLQLSSSLMNVARTPNIKQITLENYLDSVLETSFSDSDLSQEVRFVISQVRDQNIIPGQSTSPIISWQITHNGGTSSIGSQGQTPSLSQDLENFITNEKTLLIVEASFDGQTLMLISPPLLGSSNVLQ